MEMKFKSDEKNKPRERTWFSIIPVTIGNETRWLEKVTVKQVFKDYGWAGEEWENVSFSNAKLNYRANDNQIQNAATRG